MMRKPVFTGAATAIVTPFDDKGIDYETFDKLIDFQIKNNISALVVCGTTGESSTMTDEERTNTIWYAVKRVKGRIPVIAGTGSNNTAHAVRLSQDAQEVGADALLVVTPYYNKATQEGLISHYTEIAKNTDIPIIMYNVPSRTGVNISPETCRVLSGIDNICGIKEASGSLTAAEEIMRLCGDDFYVYSGNDDIILPMLSVGACGVISVLSNIRPQETGNICRLFESGKTKEARMLQLKLMPLIKALFSEVNPIPVKAALAEMGFGGMNLRPPLYGIQKDNLERLIRAMQLTVNESA